MYQVSPQIIDRRAQKQSNELLEGTKRQSQESPRPKNAKMSKLKMKTMLIVFFDTKSVIHKKLVPQGVSQRYLLGHSAREIKNKAIRTRKEIAAT